MNIQELDQYNLADAVKFNNELNPRIWAADEHLHPEVRERLLEIAADFKEFLGVKDLDLQDITISGSNAAYTYTPNSDIDLHLVVAMPDNEVYRELFDAKKYQYNETHNIKIGGADVELYVQNADQAHISQGIYSIVNNDWVQVPRRVKSVVDDTSTQNKFEKIGRDIEQAIKSGDLKRMTRLAEKIKRMRQTGLEAHGEFGPENLAFKMLRTQGMIQKLYDARNAAKDQALSLDERKKKKAKKKVRYGYGAYWYPGTSYAGQDQPAGTEGGGGDGGGGESIREAVDTVSDEQTLRDFIDFCVKELKIKSMPTVKLRRDPQWSVVNRTFGRYINDTHTLEVAFGQRHIMDVLRTVAHELTHKHQHERDGERMGPDAGETGSPWENEANARAGVLMRDYGRLHPELFDAGETALEESASGYIPTKAQAKDPRYSMALTQDIKPGQVGKEANKLKLRTNKQGAPQIANPNGLFEKLALELNQFKRKGTLVAESEQLAEVRMAPSNLAQFARSPEAEGIQAGFEAELIFRDTTSNEDDDDGDQEADMDMDERAYSLDQVIAFFESDDYGYGLSTRAADRLREQLDDSYYEWLDGIRFTEWQDNQDEPIRELHLEERPMAERIHAALVDGMDLTDDQADAVQAVGEAASNGLKGSEMTETQLDQFMQYKEAKETAEEILDEDVATSIDKQDSIYDRAKEEFDDNFNLEDDSSFFDDVGLRWMSDISSEYDLSWPFLSNSASNSGTRDWNSIGDSLRDAVDMQVKVSSGYHNTRRRPDLWIVEPDSSLKPDDSEDYGLEIISPPMPLLQALEQLQAVTDWANSAGNAYTNSTTSLHMGVSIPYKGGDVDYLKLILFLGDEYVLEQYGREANSYTRSAMKELKQRAGNQRFAASAMELMKNNLIELAEREIVRGTGDAKFTSAHKHDGKYIEFRSAGGDWLAEGDAEPGKLENTMMRYAYAMYLAGRPDLERREYAKKLYKLIAPEGDSTLALFSQFAAGELDKEQLKLRWAEKTLSKEDPKGAKKSNWKLYDRNSGSPVQGQEYNGYTYDEAAKRAKQTLSPEPSQESFDKYFELRDVGEGSQQWRVYRVDTGETLEIISAEHRGQAVDQAYDKYTGVIDFKVEPYNADAPEKELSPRAQLAKRITKPVKKQDWEVVYKPTGRVIDGILQVGAEEAQRLLAKVAQQHDFANTDNLELRLKSDEQPADVAQNFDQPSPEQQQQNIAAMNDMGDRIGAIRSNAQPSAGQQWEIYKLATGASILAVSGETRDQAWRQGVTTLRVHDLDPSNYDIRART